MTLTSILVALGLHLHLPTLTDALEPMDPTRTALSASAAVLALTETSPAGPTWRSDVVATEGSEVTFYNVNTRETERFFFRFDGVLSKDDETRLKHLFRCKRSGHQRKPDAGLVQILARLGQKYPGQTVELVSAHRAIPYAVRTSKHWSGHAVDFRIRGVKLVEVRTFLWELAATMPMGLGHYHRDGFLHVDFRAGEPSIGWDVTRRGRENYRYNPRWAQPYL
ncbi:MAG TPA: DUF882 domain-containing protein [Kofleriaceae bacterium]|nr:DUF882 domain-containing protein [Kofleriaceae bacterium]